MAIAGYQTLPKSQTGLASRILLLVVLFGAETLVASLLLDGAMPVPKGAWLTLLIHRQGARSIRFLIAFTTLFATFGYLRYGAQLRQFAQSAGETPVRWGLMWGHAAAIGAVAGLSTLVYSARVSPPVSNLLSVAWLAAVGASVVCAGLVILPWANWLELRKGTGNLWLYAGAAAAAAGSADALFRSLWRPASGLTFALVKAISGPLLSNLTADPATFTVGTEKYSIIIAKECSGLEGIGLLLVFGLVWLVMFRDELRLPHALILFPAGMVALFLLNALRITAMILIGNAGAPDIATGGFHSQAGWLALNAVSFGLMTVARRLPWISAGPAASRAPAPVEESSDATAANLVPFLCVIGAGMLAHAASATFEWLYGIRLIAGCAALWAYRRTYSRIDWRAGWYAAGLGVAAFAIWVGLDRLVGGAAEQAMPSALAGAGSARYLWILSRVVSAVVLVPVVEELAFRGYLLRRLVSADFDNVPPREFSWFALIGSSVLFGCMHGGRVLAGTIAGALFAYALIRRGRLGDAVLAHATANSLLAVYVLGFGHWQFW